MMSCNVYIATRMTGRDKAEMVARAKYVSAVLKQYGLTPISPVVEENVNSAPGPLINDSKERLQGFWRRDKEIIRYEAHVVLIDGAEAKSFGVEREYSLNRGTLWKPTVLLVGKHNLTVADFEDDYIATDLRVAAEFIRHKFGTRWKRWKWRAKMLNASLPQWLYDQLLAWR